MEKISPRIDIAFKKIFGVEENKDLLISLINSIVSEEDKVVEVTLLNPYNPRNFKQDKLSILDIKAKGQQGKRYNIEIQISDEADYDKRALYYWAKLYTEQLKITEDYSNLSKAIGIHILNFTSILHEDKYHNVFNIREKDSNLLYFKDLELHTIELKKFCANVREDLSDIAAKVKNSLDMWLAFLTRHDLLNKERLPSGLDDPALKKALGVLEVMNFGDEERQAYEEHLKWFMIESNTLRKYEAKGYEAGREEERKRHEEERKRHEEERKRHEEERKRHEEERKRHEEEQRKQAEEKKNMIRKMLAKGMGIEEIIEITGLSVKEIQSIQRDA